MTTDQQSQKELLDAQRRIAEAAAQLRRAQAEHDAILRKLADSQGCHDRRFAVR